MDPTTSKMSWARWPQQVRLLILQALVLDHGGGSLADYATVSREWQNVIERHTFARIKLTPSRLADFDSMTHRNRALVNYIWLCVELEDYSPLEAYAVGTRFVSQRDHGHVTEALWTLLTTLGNWEPSGELLLDISVHSPSDSRYLLKYLTFGPDVPPNECSGLGNVDRDLADKAGQDWNHWSALGKADRPIRKTLGWIYPDGSQFDESSPEDDVLEREMEWWDRLPTVPAVTGVLLRQQTRRQWFSSTLGEMFAHFPRLQEVFYEPWRLPDRASQRGADEEYEFLLESLALQGVRSITIFENYNRYYSRLIPAYQHTRLSATAGTALSRTAASASRELEHFSASFLIDAGPFFSSCRPSWGWANLRSLTLTSRLLARKASQPDLADMLISAAVTALRMPQLETMELWNGREGLATAFKYQSRHTGTTITWRSTWDFALLPLVATAWGAVANRHGARGLAVKKELLHPRANIRSHGDAIHHLKLSNPVVRPVSLQQIRTEHKVHSMWEEMRRAKKRQQEIHSA